MHGLKSSVPGISKMIEERNIHVFIGTEAMTTNKKKFGNPFLPVVNNPGQHHHGTVVAINPKLLPNTSGKHINCVQSSTHVCLRLKYCTIIGIYLPQVNPLETLIVILKAATPSCILFGDVNFDVLSSHLTIEQRHILELLEEYGFNHVPNGTDFSFFRVDTRMPSRTQRTNIDQVFAKDEFDLIHKIKVHMVSDSLIFSDHKAIILDIVLNNDDTFILGKASRFRDYLLIPENTTEFKDGKFVKTDSNEQTRSLFQNAINVELFNRTGQIKQSLLEACNTHLSSQRRQESMNSAIRILNGGILDSATTIFGTTKPMPLITRAELSEMAAELHLGNSDAAAQIMSNLQRKIALEFDAKKIGKTPTDHIKQMGAQRRRIAKESGSLNPNNVEQYLSEWIPKWGLVKFVPKKIL